MAKITFQGKTVMRKITYLTYHQKQPERLNLLNKMNNEKKEDDPKVKIGKEDYSKRNLIRESISN